MQISAILFDIGGVLIELDGLPSLAKLLDSQQTYDEIYQQWMASPSVIAHETGKIDAAEFAVGAINDLNLSLSPEAFLANFSTWIVGTFPNTFNLLDRIPASITVAALSNTSAPHWRRVEKTGLANKFDALFLSHEIGHLKLDIQAFQVVLDELNLPAEEIIFFDDNIDNVNAAAAIGFKAHQATNPEEARQILDQYNLIEN